MKCGLASTKQEEGLEFSCLKGLEFGWGWELVGGSV